VKRQRTKQRSTGIGYYALLESRRGDSFKEIEKKWRKLSCKYSPEALHNAKNDRDMTKECQAINVAWDGVKAEIAKQTVKVC
jgi:curved DNA-binding protein CbpA